MSWYTETSFDPRALPSEPFGRRAALLLQGIQPRVDWAVAFYRDQYPQRELFLKACDFAFVDYWDAPRGDFDSLARVGFFPWMEAQHELGEAINNSLLPAYRSAFDNCRRALELSTAGAYFLQPHVNKKDGGNWVHSQLDTPHFSRMLKALLLTNSFASIHEKTDWANKLKKFYFDLCNVVHVRGEEKSYRNLQPTAFRIDDVELPTFKVESLQQVADTILLTIRHTATIVAIENPILLVGFDLERKFGSNGPMSGFFTEIQTERLLELVLDDCRDALKEYASSSAEVHGLVEWFDALPDITEEQLKEQMEHWERLASGKHLDET